MLDFNVLTLDGGGVRGLSTLVILKELMRLINQITAPEDRDHRLLEPADIFDLVVGTSTGGLIALMLVKLGMSVDDCIVCYKVLSQQIFSKWHKLGYATGGFGRWKKYCGKRLRAVLIQHALTPALEKLNHPSSAEDFLLEDVAHHESFACAVVCRELDRETYDRRDDEVFLCSHRDNSEAMILHTHACRKPTSSNQSKGSGKVKVADAARATSAAPTYFSHVEVEALNMILVDGGFGETNNPSFVTWGHYFTLPKHAHQLVHMVNLGTGSKPKNQKTKKKFNPNSLIKGFVHTIKGLADLATASDQVERQMRVIECSDTALKFSRFSANVDNIHEIELCEYKKCNTIEELTYKYLGYDCQRKSESGELSLKYTGKSDISDELNLVAKRLAETYLTRRQRLRDEQRSSSLHNAQFCIPASDGQVPDNSPVTSRTASPLPPFDDHSTKIPDNTVILAVQARLA